MKHWFKDQHFRSLLRNSSYLAISRGVAMVCSLATVAFAGRGLGVILFGTMILITSYARAASGISKFQSWQLVVRYGGQGLAAGDPEIFKTSTGFAFALDVLSGVLGMIIAVAILPLLAPWVGISQEYLWLAVLYCTLLPTMGAATPSGVLRALDRFDLLSWAGTVTPIARALLAGTAFAAGAPFPVYVGIWYATDLCGDLYTWFLAVRELRRRGLLEGIRPTLKADDFAGRVALRDPHQSGNQRVDGLGPDRAAGRRRPAGSGGSRFVPGCLEPRRQRAKARRPSRQGFLSRSRAHGPHIARSRGS